MIITRFKLFIKRNKCKHTNRGHRWVYPEQWIYNQFFKKAQTTRYKEIYCKDCGKFFGTVLAEPVFTDTIETEVKEEYLKNKHNENII